MIAASGSSLQDAGSEAIKDTQNTKNFCDKNIKF
jgi:hypothetical protein